MQITENEMAAILRQALLYRGLSPRRREPWMKKKFVTPACE